MKTLNNKCSRRKFLKDSVITAGVIAGQGIDIPIHAESVTFPAHPPMGIGKGIFPGRVVWKYNPSSVNWNGVDYWWKPENFNADAILTMIRQGIMQLTGADTSQAAWHALFEWRNKQNGKTGGYKQGQKIAIKINMNGAGEYNDDKNGNVNSSYGNAVLLQQLLRSIVTDGDVHPDDLTVFDTCRIFPVYMQEMCSRGDLKGVHFKYRDPGGKNDAVSDKSAPIIWSQEIKGETSYLPLCLTEADYLINLANLKGHSWGMTLGAKNHFGSFNNSDRRNTPATAGLHPNIIESSMDSYSVLTDLMANRYFREKTILWILDALITAPSETGSITPAKASWKIPPFNGGYAASLFFSQDPVAIDSVGGDFLTNDPNMRAHNGGLAHKRSMENYLHEAALIDNPPSGTFYSDGSGKKLQSLGVHEHWNNSHDKQYSRNLGKSEGIELVS